MRYAFYLFGLFITPLSKQIMGDSFLKLQEMYSFSQNVCIEVYGILIARFTPNETPVNGTPARRDLFINTFPVRFIPMLQIITIYAW